jgi:ribonucleoside-diphosphate reductase alpha subunit
VRAATTINNEMNVIKRNGSAETVSFDKILTRVKLLGKEHNIQINYTSLVMKVIEQLHNNIHTSKIDELTAEQAASMSIQHPSYGKLASVLVISNLHKNTTNNFVETMNQLYNFKDVNNKPSPLVSEEYINVINKYGIMLNEMINYKTDYLIDYFGFKTLERAYLFKLNGRTVERPQDMWMRVAIGIHMNDITSIKETYHYMSNKYFTHATPTLFNAGTPRPQLSSCYLIAMEDDSVDGIFNTLKECAKISKWAGGIGLHIHNIRAKGSHIRGTNGTSNGIVPMLNVFNKTARYIDQGGGRRNGSFAIYIEPHHSDIEDFLDLRKNHGDEELRARDLFYALWISDLFMERVHNDETWSLFCPDIAIGLSDTHGDAYKKLYKKYENEKKYTKQIKARSLWIKILDAQMETGTPYLLFKDAANEKSNQKNLGTIKSSNLCTEIIEYSNENETAVCNLASIALNKCVFVPENPFNNVKIYTKDRCEWCVLLKQLLDRRHVEYEEVVLSSHDDINIFKSSLNVKTVPQLLDQDGKLIGGYTDVLNLLRCQFDYKLLHKLSKILTKNLDKIIDRNFYPTEKTKRSNFYHRPIGIGVQGLADTFILMDIPFDSKEAREINKRIFETIYHGSLEQSMEIAQEREYFMSFLKSSYYTHKDWEYDHHENIDSDSLDLCRNYLVEKWSDATNHHLTVETALQKYKPLNIEINREKYLGAYSSFEGSPASQGILQFDLWKDSNNQNYDWNSLKQKIKEHGLRNSLLVAPMPTASTSQILGNNECFEPFTSNIYTRRTFAGEFILANKYLIQELIELNIWNDDIKNNIILNKGSIQQIDIIPKFIRDKYKIVWEIPMKQIIDMAKERGAYICQSQSMNLWLEDPDPKTLTNMHFYSWKAGLKTGIYYLRRKPKHQAQQFTIDPTLNSSVKKLNTTSGNASGNACDMCSG